MSTTPCPEEAELLSFVDAALPPESLTRIQHHLSQCGACAGQLEVLRELIGDIAAPLVTDSTEEFDIAPHVDAVLERLDEPVADKLRPKPLLWGGALLGLAAAASLVFVQLGTGDNAPEGQWAARGSATENASTRGVRIQLYAKEAKLRPLTTGSNVTPGTAFTAGLRNIAKKSAHLLLFAVDSQSVVHWVSPQFVDPQSDPKASVVSASSEEKLLPSAVVFDDLAPGPLRIVTLLSANSMRVSQIESLGPSDLSEAALKARFSQAEVRQLTVTLGAETTP